MELAVISGKGGTGKSSITAAFASLEEPVVVVDCDVDAANLFLVFNPQHDEETVYIGGEKALIDKDTCLNCGMCISYCRFDAIAFKNGKVHIIEEACDGCKLCSRVCPVNAISMIPNDKSRMYAGRFRYGKMVYGRLAPGEENSGKLVNMVREKAREVAQIYHIENIIIDGPPGIGCAVVSTITGTDNVVIVTEPSMSGLHDLNRSIEICRQFQLKVWVIINKYDLNKEFSQQIDEFCKANQIEVIAMLPFDVSVVEAMVQCKSIVEHNPDSEISTLIKNAYYKILQA